MKSFWAILREGEARRAADAAAEFRQDHLDQAFAVHRARQEEKRKAGVAESWDRVMATITPAGPDQASENDAEQDEKPHQPQKRPPPRRRRFRRRGHGGAAALARTAIALSWDKAMEEASPDM